MTIANLESALRLAGESVHQPLHAKYVILRTRLQTIDYGRWAAGFPEGNDHGFTHIDRVLEKLSGLLGPQPLDEIRPYELFLTVMSVLYHDIGLMQQRSDHAGISALLVDEERNEYIIDKRDREVIRAAVASHSSHRDIDTETASLQVEMLIGDQRVRPKVVAALVRLADELDEDYRRADPILQAHSKLPARSRFYWEFCQRISGIQPLRQTGTIEVAVDFLPGDIGRLVLVGGSKRAFVAAFAEKLAKINRERVYVNKFLPTALQFRQVTVTVRPLPGEGPWRTPRDFNFDDASEARNFLQAFPELFQTPASEMLRKMLDRIQGGDLTGAARLQASLEPLVPDLPKTLSMKIMYDAACISSLRADETDDDQARSAFLDAAIRHVGSWAATGFDGGFAEKGETAHNEIYRLGSDSHLRCMLSERRADVISILGSQAQSALPADVPRRVATGAGGCVVAGTQIHTPSGQVLVEDLRSADQVISSAGAPRKPTANAMSRVTTSRQTICFEVDGSARLSATQPVLLGDGSWVTAETLAVGVLLAAQSGGPKPIQTLRRLVGHFEVYDLEVVGDPHTFVAGGVICHNKKPFEPIDLGRQT